MAEERRRGAAGLLDAEGSLGGAGPISRSAGVTDPLESEGLRLSMVCRTSYMLAASRRDVRPLKA